MKNLKKLGSIALALVMVMAMMIPAFAADNGSITVDNAKEGETYTLYKIFGATYLGTGDERSMNYFVDGNSFWEKKIDNDNANCPFKKTTTNGGSTYYITLKDESTSGEVVAGWLKDNISGAPAITPTKTPGEGETSITWDGLDYGYYYIDTTTGSAVTVNNVAPDVVVQDKNEAPVVTKDFDGTLPAQIQVGDTIKYKITIDVKKGAENYKLVDTMGAGLEFQADTFKVDGVAAAATITRDASDKVTGFEYQFTAEKLTAALATETKQIVVTYDVKILDTAAIPNGAEITADNTTNSAKVTFGDNQETTPSTKDVDLYWFHLVKVDGEGNVLNGATFQLFKSEADATANVNPIKFVYDEDNKTYTVNTTSAASENIVVNGGFVKVNGLKGDYYLKETVAPTGYNLKTELIPVTVDENSTAANITAGVAAEGLGVQVINNSGAVLPSTGGMGTTIFYAIGGILLAGSAILFVTKKRMGE